LFSALGGLFAYCSLRVCGISGARAHTLLLSPVATQPPDHSGTEAVRLCEDAEGAGLYGLNPARSIPSRASGFSMNTFQTYPVRAFSAMSRQIPRSIPTTSVSYQLFRGLNASTKPYALHALG